MNLRPYFAAAVTIVVTCAVVPLVFAAQEDNNPIKEAMNFAHKAPKGEKKLNEKIADGTAAEADIKKALELYKAMADTKPPKGDPAAFKERTDKLVTATQEVLAKNPSGVAHYKTAVDCKACHTDFRVMRKEGPGPRPGI
jgi:cytochrome c556